jgi:L-lactate dehydrogenase (cytochrome)
MKLADCNNISDLRIAAQKRAHKMVFDYIDGGADDEITLARNSAAFMDYELIHKILVGVDAIDTSHTILGTPVALPFFPGPTAGNRLFHKDGEREVAKAAQKAGVIYCLSTLASVSIEEITEINSGPKWFQLYVWKDRGLIKEMLDRAKAAGFGALILTVDLPVQGNRERDIKNQFTIPPKVTLKQITRALKRPAWTWDYLTSQAIQYANINTTTSATSLAEFVAAQLNSAFDWRDAEWLLGEWNGPAVIKGIAHPDDAQQAVKTGFNGITISNHGGRQLDTGAAPIDLLAPVLDSVGNDAEVIVDGGIRRGTDVIKALAMGATATSFGRPYLYGLAAGGEKGVTRAFEMLAEELSRDMALLGVRSIAEIDASFIRMARSF